MIIDKSQVIPIDNYNSKVSFMYGDSNLETPNFANDTDLKVVKELMKTTVNNYESRKAKTNIDFIKKEIENKTLEL